MKQQLSVRAICWTVLVAGADAGVDQVGACAGAAAAQRERLEVIALVEPEPRFVQHGPEAHA